jgi:hypothetical protein
MFAQQDDWGIINTMLTRKSIGENQTMYRGLSMKDMADIVGYQTRPARALQNGKEWMDKFGYTSMVDEAPWTHFASGWKDNAVELIKKSGLPEPRYSDLEASAPFKWFAPALKPGQSWIPDKAKSFTNSLDWAKNIAHQGGTAGGETDAVAKVIFDKNVKGISNLMDLGIGGNRASLSDKEMYIAPFTEYILKQINPLAHKIPGEGSFVGNQWIGGKNYSKLIDEYVFEAKRTLPSGHIPHFAGGGLVSGLLSKAKSLAYKPINFLNQYINYFKARGMVKKGMFHGSADLGRNSDGPFNGITELGKDYSRDPYYGMGFYGTTSKAEADLYAGGYNAPGQWGESYGSLNKITKIPFGRYLDFSKNLKKQNYGLWSILGKQGFMGAGENLGSLMNKSGMTGSIMPRISAGMAPGDINAAKWIALNKPEGTKLTSNFANGGMVKYKLPSYYVGSPYIPEDQIAQLHKGERVLTAEQNKNFSSSGPVTNNITINGADKDPKQIAQEVMIQLERIQSKNNKTNLVGA